MVVFQVASRINTRIRQTANISLLQGAPVAQLMERVLAAAAWGSNLTCVYKAIKKKA